MDLPTDLLTKLDVVNLVVIIAALWIFNSRLDRKFDKIDAKIDDMNLKMSEMDKRMGEMDKRLYGIETVLHMKDCCVLKQDQNLKRAE